ncbi:MAG TPA: MarR family transcriptional regulator [Gemmatimonadales bacterium]|nr:MarR family transcriptional regulator [Gemmatimonadales bacterium]
MDRRTQSFVNRVAPALVAEGLPRIAGRIVALLLVRDAECSLDDLVRELGVSKASASTNTRLLRSRGMIERVGRPGDRRDFYRLTPHLFVRTMEDRLARWRRFHDAVAEGRRLGRSEAPAVRHRLEEFDAAYAYMAGVVQDALDRWHRGPRSGGGIERPA